MSKFSENNFNDIIQALAHRYPFLFVDRILSIDSEKHSIKTLKNLSINEYFFQGHFPNQPIYPGVLIIESFAQSSSILFNYMYKNQDENNFFALTKINQAKFIHFVKPGDQLIIKVRMLKKLHESYFIMEGEAFVDDKKIASSEFTAMKIKSNG